MELFAKRTEELEEAGYSSPTWVVLRALQQINSATRIKETIAFNAELADESTWLWLTSDHQRGQYYEHYSRSLVPRELKEKPLLPFSQRDEEIYSSGWGKKDQR